MKFSIINFQIHMRSQNLYLLKFRSLRIWLKRAGPSSLDPCMGMVTRLPSGWWYMAWLPFWRENEKPSRSAARMTSLGFGKRGILIRLCGYLNGYEAYRLPYRNKFGLFYPVFYMKLDYFANII